MKPFIGLPSFAPKPPYEYVEGVPTLYQAHLHPYPTRYHGGLWRRPVFTFPYVQHVQSVFKPDDSAPLAYRRYPWWPDSRKPMSYSGLGVLGNGRSNKGIF